MSKFLLTLLVFFFINSADSYSKQRIITVSMVNNIPITNIDIENEIFLIKILNPSISEKSLSNIALRNLIDDALKNEEIKKNNIQVLNRPIKKKYKNFLSKLNQKSLPEAIKKNIYSKIKTEVSWTKLILKKFSRNSYVNINEIEEKIKKIDLLSKNNEDQFDTKDKMIKSEKNKNINTSSNTYLNKLKNEALIKIY